MNAVIRYVLIWLSTLCAVSSVAAETRATVLWYMEQEAGNDPWEVRYIVTDRYLRSDDGEDSGDFVLLDLGKKEIYNVVRESRTILNIDGQREASKAPATLDIEVLRSHDSKAPTLEDKKSLTLELRANGEACDTSVVVAGLMDDVSAAFDAFADVLAVQQQRSIGNTPAQYVTPCFLARYLYAADFAAAAGLPVISRTPDGAQRQLIRYQRDVLVDEVLFVLPEGYERFQPLK